jgi:hypothetical protein
MVENGLGEAAAIVVARADEKDLAHGIPRATKQTAPFIETLKWTAPHRDCGTAGTH